MNALYLIRHGMTRANEQRLYSGATDLPLTDAGRAAAEAMRRDRPLPECGLYASSGMRRADETLELLTGHKVDVVLPEFREINFGAFELRSYEELRHVPEYVRWAADTTGDVCCPEGESMNGFRARVSRGAAALAAFPQSEVLLVCHGGVIVNLMQTWFPCVQRHFYEWQPAACRGYRVSFADGAPQGFVEI